MTNWKEIHPDFTPQLQEQWEKNGFDYEETKWWLKAGLQVNEADCADYLKQKHHNPRWLLLLNDLEKLRKEYYDSITLSYLLPIDSDLIPPTLSPIEPDLTRIFNSRYSNSNSFLLTNFEFLNNYWGEQDFAYKQVQECIEIFYPSEQRKTITKLDITNNRLIGELDCSDFTNLKTLNIANAYITIKLEYLPDNLEEIYCVGDLAEQLKNYKQGDYYSCQEWKKDYLVSNGLLVEEIDFFIYLKNKKLILSEARNKLFQLRTEYYRPDVNNEKLSIEVIKTLKNFELGSGKPQLTSSQKSLLEQLILNQTLKARYEGYGFCSDCCQPNAWGNDNIKKYWCQYCSNLTGEITIDEFIRGQQSTANKRARLLEFISYENFTKHEHLAEGGFGTVYKAKWNKGDKNKKDVALKNLHNSQNITNDFLKEITNHKKVDINNLIVKCSGITQNPETKNYLLVMDYIKDGSLRQLLTKDCRQLSFKNKLEQLARIAEGLKGVHKLGLVHHDFHPGNVLNKKQGSGEKQSIFCYITDFGLCRPANETDQGKVYGVLPYVAPEVLIGESYTQAADIYSFGIIAYELLANSYPYPNHNLNNESSQENLATQICHGLRPSLDEIKIPQLLKDLIRKCWDTDAKKRSTAGEISKLLYKWHREIEKKNDAEFAQQAQELKSDYKQFCQNTPYRICPNAIVRSKLINTKEITRLLHDFKDNLLNKTSELNTRWVKVKALAERIKNDEENEESFRRDSEKYNEFKKALKLALETSQEIEKILASHPLISDDAKEILKKVKESREKLQEKNHSCQKIIERKQKELDNLKSNIIINNQLDEEYQEKLTELLEKQEEVIEKNNEEKFVKRLENLKGKLKKKITELEINSLCQIQTEITQLELEIKKDLNQQTKQLTQIVSNLTNQTLTLAPNKELEQVKLELEKKGLELENLEKELENSKKNITPLLTAKEKAWQTKFQDLQTENQKLKSQIIQSPKTN